MREKKPIVIDGAYAPLFDEFVAYKRGIGYGYTKSTIQLIRLFSRFLSRFPECPEVLTRETVDAFCAPRPGESMSTRNKRVVISRQFALFVRLTGIDCYVPPERHEKVTSDFVPYIISESEMARVIARADEMPPLPCSAKTGIVCSMLLRILWCCGLRISEALSLTLGDVDLGDAVLTIRKAKYNQTRFVPISASLAAYVRGYWRDMGFSNENPGAFFFPNKAGAQYSRGAAAVRIKKIMLEAGVTRDGTTTPRVHDVRHSFAIGAFKKMESEGMDAYSSLPLLATYMGHSDIKSTEYYLRLTGNDLERVVETMAGCYEGVFPEVD
jgi:integrase